MRLKISLWIGISVVLIALFGVAAEQASMAEEVHSKAGDARPSTPPDGSAASGGANDRSGAANLEKHAPAESGDGAGSGADAAAKSAAAKGGERGNANEASGENGARAVPPGPNSFGATGNAIEGIDTRITVLPRRLGGKRDNFAVVKAKRLLAHSDQHLRPPPRVGATDPIARNAIGEPLPRRGSSEAPGGLRRDSPPLGHGLAAGVPSFANGGAESAAKTPALGGAVPATRRAADSITNRISPNSGAINGTGLARPGSSPLGIGGPAQSSGSVSGSAIRPRH